VKAELWFLCSGVPGRWVVTPCRHPQERRPIDTMGAGAIDGSLLWGTPSIPLPPLPGTPSSACTRLRCDHGWRNWPSTYRG